MPVGEVTAKLALLADGGEDVAEPEERVSNAAHSLAASRQLVQGKTHLSTSPRSRFRCCSMVGSQYLRTWRALQRAYVSVPVCGS